METLTNFIKWFDGKKTIIGGILLFIAGLFTDVLIGKLGLTDKWIIAAAEIMHYVGMGLAGVGLLHKGGKAVMPVAAILLVTFGLSSCSISKFTEVYHKKVKRYVLKHNDGSTVTQLPNGAIAINVKVKNLYDPAPVKKTFTVANVHFDAVGATLELNTVTTDTTIKLRLPSFKK